MLISRRQVRTKFGVHVKWAVEAAICLQVVCSKRGDLETILAIVSNVDIFLLRPESQCPLGEEVDGEDETN